MSSFLQSILTYVLLYKYEAIFLVTILGEIGIPIPAGGAISASGFIATQGYFRFSYVFIAALLGNIAGDQIIYWLARRYGNKILTKIGLHKLLIAPPFKALESRLIAHPVATVFISRFTLTPIANILTGLAKMPYATFLIVGSIGEIADVALLMSLGALFGSQWEYLDHVIGTFGIALVFLILLLMVLFWKRITKRIHRSS
ncbi:MAG TPA: DedA family protein [Patescibacteria group bacterium]|nr:DedA family protein [Patescibacteria group bacterium]